jgi:hypothetical protein
MQRASGLRLGSDTRSLLQGRGRDIFTMETRIHLVSLLVLACIIILTITYVS